MARPSPHELPEYLTPKLSEPGRQSFRKLCIAMCSKCTTADPQETWPCRTLAFFLELLCLAEVNLNDGTKLNLHSLDSYDSALGEFTSKNLERIECNVGNLIDKINRLKRTPLVWELNRRHLIPLGDVLSNPNFPCNSHFQGLLLLRKTATLLLGNPRKP